jgi:hypothetical protein
MKYLTGPEIVEVLSKTGTKEWNEAISCRLEALRSYLSQDEWEKGISIHLKAVMGNAIAKILGEQLTPESVSYLRGFCAALKMVASLPQSVEGAISTEASKTKTGPQGDAGY